MTAPLVRIRGLALEIAGRPVLRGIDLEGTRGRSLRIGGCLVRIYNETRPCEQMDEAHAGLRAALGPRWRAGAYGEIVESGRVAVGDTAVWELELNHS